MANKYWWEEDEKQTDNKTNSQSSSKAVKKYWWDDGTITKTFYDNVVNRTNSWIESSNTYLSNYQNRFSNRKFNNEDAYVSDSASWLDSFKTTGTGLQQEANDILNYVEQYKDFLDEDFVNEIKSTLGSTSQQYGQLIDYATKDNEYWSQWETEDDYKSYLEGVKNHEALLSYDLGAGAKEIDGLRRFGDHYSTVTNLYTNYLNGLIELYEPEATETPKEGYEAYEGYNPNAFEYEYDANGRLVDSVHNKYQINGRYITKEGLDKLVSEYEILSKKYGNYGDFASTLSEKERYHKQAERTQEGAKLASVSGNADFNNYSGYVRNTGNYVYDLVNNKGAGFEYIDKNEIAVFNYYVAKGDEASAEKYLDSIRETLNYRQAEAMADDMEGNYLQEIFFQAKVGVDQFSSGMKGLWNAVTGNEEYVPASATQIAGGMAREDLGNMDLKWYNFKDGEWDDANIFGNSLGQVMADATSTTFNMLPSVLTSTAVNFVAPGSGAAVGSMLLGASASGNAYQEMINLGYSKGQARNYAVLVGGSEAILQYALGGISSLSGGGTEGIFQSIASKWLPHVDNAFARVAIKLGSNMLDEGLEEGIQEILNPWFKNLTLHTNEKVNWSDVAYSSLLGALTAGFMEGPSTIAGDVKTYKTGKKLQAADISAERLAKIGSTFSADTVAYQLAGKVNENTGAYTMGRLFNEIGATLTTQNVNEITTELMKRGMDAETAKANAEALAYVVEGGQLTDMQIAIIEANDVLAGVARTTLIDANTTWNQRAKGYNDTLMSLANEMTSRKAAKASKTKQAQQTQENTPATDTVDTQTETSTESLPEADTVDTSPAKVKNIADISKKTIKLEDGSEVNVKDADLSPDDGVRIETIASIDGISTEDANFVLNTLRTNTGASAQMDSLGAKEAYKYGFYGLSQDHMTTHGVFANSLTEEQRQAIYETGKKARQKQIESASPKATTKERGIYFDHGNGNVVAFKDANKSALTEGKRKAGVQAAVILHKLGIGGDIYFFESYRNAKGKLVYKDANGVEKKAPNGWYSETDGSIHIDLNAGVKGDGLVLFTLSHELTHFIEQWSPQKYKILADFLVENYENGQSMDKLVRAKQEHLSNMRRKKVSYDEAYSEVIADSMEAMLADGNVMEKILELKAKDEGLVAKIKQFFENLLVKIRNTYKGLTPDSAEGQAVLAMTESIEKIQQLFAEALVEASDNFQTAQAQFSTDSIRGNADGAVAQSEVTTVLVEAADGEILKSERTEYEALPKQVMSLSDGSGKLLNFIEGLVPTKLKGLSGRTTNGYTGRDVRAYAMEINGFTKAQIKEVNKFMDAMSEFMDKAGVTYKFIGLKDVKDAKLHYTYNADGSIKSIVLSAMVKNGDYPVNFDLSSICKKRVAMSKLIDKLATRGSLDSGTVKLTPANIFKINTALKNEGYETACLGCFVESKRYNSLEWAKTFCNKWNAAVKKVNPNATYFGYGDNTFNDDSFTLEQAVKIDEAATKYLTTTKVERLANALKKYKAREQAGLPLVEKFSDAAKKRLVKSETISDELKDKYLNIDLTTLTMADVEFLLENEVLPGASLSNKQAVTEMVKSGEAYQHLLRPSDLLTDRGISKLEALPNFHGVLYGHYGSGTPKLMQSYTPYNSEIALLPANKNNDQTLAEYLYTIAGVRMQSFSDFQIQNIYDYLQMVADLSARKLPAHAYTKEISFAKLLGMTGIKVNLSVMFDIDPMVDKAHAGLTKLNKLVHRGEYAKVVLEDEQGKWVYNIGDYQTQKLFAEAFPDEAKRFLQSIGFGDAVKLQSTPGYSANCGIIGVGYSDLGIFAMLDDNRIRYIIPYHASSLPAEIKLATNIALGTDYTSYQNNMKIAGIVDKNGNAVNWSIKEAYKRLGSGQAVINELNEKVRTEGWVVTTKKAQTGHGTYGLYEDLQKTNDPRQTTGNFMDWCIGNGTLPLFYQFASHENYYKLLYDFNVYDCVTEEYAPQQAVTNTYPTMVDGQVQPGNVTDGGFDTEYFQGAIDKQMAFMDDYSRNLDEDLEELADNLEAGTKMSDRYSPEALFAKDPLAVATFPVKEVPTKRKKVNLPEVVKEAKRGTGSIVYAVDNEKPIIQSYVYIPDIGSNVLVNTRGITHGAQGRITNSSTMSTAEVEQVLPDVLRNSIAVNELSPRAEDIANGVVKSYILFGYAKRADGKEYLVRSTINHFDGNKSLAESIAIYDVLKGMKAKKMDSVVIGSHTGSPAASHLNTAKSNFTISVKDLLEIVKENYPELLSDNFREYYGVTVPKADDLLFSDRDNVPTFYSLMAKVVDGVKQEKLGATSVVSMLRGKGVKAEEIKWSGIEAWLEGKKSVTKAELQEFIAGSMLQIEEEILDNKDRPYTEDQQKRLDENTAKRDEIAKQLAGEWKKITGNDFPVRNTGADLESAVVNAIIDANKEHKDASFEGRLLEKLKTDLKEVIANNDDFGFDSWRDALRSIHRHRRDFIPHYEMSTNDKAVIVKYCNALNAYNELSNLISDADADKLRSIAKAADLFNRIIGNVKSEYYAENAKHMTKWGQYKLKGGDNYQEILFKIPGSFYSNTAMNVHWGERDGVLAHARIQDINTFLGKMLFIEEIQSDWHNEGHKSGYDSDEAAILEKIKDLKKQWHSLYTEMLEASGAEARAISEKMDAIDAERANLAKKVRFGESVPDAPFKDNYHEYVLKRLLREAAERDYDSIGWTTADVQMDRWNPDRKTNEQMGIEAKNPNAVAFEDGYRIEYDQDIPKFLSKYGKKWGTTVGKTVLDNGTEVWSMAITDSMKESVMTEGQPLYSDRDSEGNQLSAEQQEFFKDSKVRDANGNLLKVFHGTPKKFTTFRQGTAEGWGEGIYFTDNIEAAKEFGENIVEAYLNITNPFNIDTMSYYDIDFESTKAYQNFDKKYWQRWYDEYDTYEEYRDDGMGVDIDMIYTEYVDVFNKILRELGYDGIIAYQSNNIDGYEIVAFHENQPKLTSNTAPTISDDMRYQDRADESVSNRSLLANAFEGLAQNDIEKNKIQEYKGKIDLINSEEQKLSELNQQIKELSFAKGPRDTKKIRDLQFEARQTANRINTYDKQLLRLEASKPLQDVLAREKKKAYEKAEKRGKEALDKYKERAAKTQRELLERWQDSRKKGIENREKTAMKHKIQRVVGELNQLLLNGDKSHHVPENLKKAVADALALVNMDTVGAEERAAKYAALIAKETDPDKIDAYTVTMENILRQGEKMGKRLKELRDAYEEISESTDPDIANAYDPVIAGSLKELAQSIGDTSLKNMTIEQLQDVYDMYKMVLTRVRDANKSFLNEKREAISSLASRVVGEVKRVGGEQKFRVAFLDFVKKFGWDNLKPVYAFEHIGSGTLADVFNSVRAGEDTWAVDVTEAREYYLGKSKKYGYDSWDFKKKYHFKSASELEFDLTLEQILSLYAYSKREQTHDHLRLGGFVFDSNIETYKEKDKGGKSILKYKVNTADAHQITPEILANIISNLSDEQKSFVDEMQDYLSTVMGAKGNEVTMAMYGVKLFKEKFYFPLKSAKQFMFEQNDVAGEVKIKNSGFTNKVVVKANNPVILSNFMDVWAGHVNDMSMYHAFVLPLEDFNRVFNYNSSKQEGQPPVSVKGTIQNAYGPSAVGYVRQLITDLNGGARTDSTTGFINKMMGLFKKGSVFASLSVVVQQPSAVARAVALVDTKYFIGPKVDHKRHKALWDEVKQYAPVAIIKEMGYFDTNMGKSTQDFILAKEYSGFKEKMKALVTDSGFRDEALSKAPALADELAWCSIWEAVKRETQAKNPNMDVKSESFLKIAGERFTEVITKTQVYDSVLARSGMMRSKDTGMKMATAFMAEPTTSINMIADALLQGKRGNKKYAGAAIGAVIASQILNSILVSFVYAGRDDDEDETYVEKYIGTLTGEMLDSLNPATYIPFIKDIVSIAQGYDVERSDMAIVSDLWKAWENLSKDSISPYRKVEGFAGSIAQIFGLPVKNIMRDVRGIYQTIDSFVNGPQTTGAGIGYAVKSELPKLFGGGDVSNKEQLYEAYLNGDSTHIARVQGRFKDQSAANSAMRSAIKEHFESGDIDNDTAEEYLVEYGGMKKDDAYWRVQEWENEMETGEDFHKFDDFYTAVQTGKNLKTVIKEYTDNGVEAKTLASQITSYFKPLYKEMSNTERAAIKGYLLNAYQLLGYNRSEKSKDIDKWLKD